MVRYQLMKEHKNTKLSLVAMYATMIFFGAGILASCVLTAIDVNFSFLGLFFFGETVLSIIACLPTIRALGFYATIAGEVLTLYTRNGKLFKKYYLRDMNKIYAHVSLGRRSVTPRESLLLYPKTTELDILWCRGVDIPLVNWDYYGEKKWRFVVIQNKELEEKILAYYGEPITEPDTAV